MKIRKATLKDIPQMMDIIKINSPNYPKPLAKKEIKEMFSKSLHKPTYLVVEDKEDLLAFGGFVRSWIDSMIFNIFWVNTNPKYKNRGIGKKLIKALIGEIKKIKEKPKVRMIIISTKIPAFYKKFGFKKTTEKYDRDYILMEKKLK
jgi:ribosomal protein S18 acetylase RimI-like enzyme